MNQTINKLKYENEELREIIIDIKRENELLRERLNKYTNPDRYKKYYEKKKGSILENKKHTRLKSLEVRLDKSEARLKSKDNFHTYVKETMTQAEAIKRVAGIGIG